MTEDIIYNIIILIIAVLLAYLYGKFQANNISNKKETNYTSAKIQLEQELKQIKELYNQAKNNIDKLTLKKEELLIEVTQKDSSIRELSRRLSDHYDETEQLQQKFKLEFENLANRILEEKSNKFTLQNQVNIKQILEPLNEKIKSFEKKVEDTHKESIDYQAALRQQIIGLKELNHQMSKEAINLTKALKGDSKTQGTWGELVLARVLEKSGLEEGREYEIEKSFNITNDDKQYRLRPDVIIHLPDNKKMVIDSKVSLTDYEKYVHEENEIQKASYLSQHLKSLLRHITQLSDKKYEDLYEIESPNFVLLFIPIEPAFAAALNLDDQLYNKAFDKNIVIVTPTTLLATLQTIDSMWNNSKQQQNAIEIASQAGKLYDKFEGLIKDLSNVGRKMDSAKKDYESAMNKLSDGKGNLLTQVEKLKKMGAKAKKSLPEVIK